MYYSPQNRKLKVITIGAGVSGIMMAYRLLKDMENVEHTIYEKNHDIGGTWLVNRYPGAACDIPSHAYVYNFALNPEWSHFFSPATEIWEYLDRVVKQWDLRKYMTFKSEIVGCYWGEEESQWTVKVRKTDGNGDVTEFDDHCDVLLHATGVLNKWKWPEIKGLDKFKGKIIHTANWPEKYEEEQWKGEKVAIIGSGASSIQTVPTMQSHVKSLDVFVRTPVWFVDLAGNQGLNSEYTPEQQKEFRANPEKLVAHAKDLEEKVNAFWSLCFRGSEVQKTATAHFTTRMKDLLKKEALVEGYTPKWSVACRRITPGDPYMNAVGKDNVTVHFTQADEITEDGVVGADGSKCEVDTIICATGELKFITPVVE